MKAKTKAIELKTFKVAGQPLVLHKGNVYLANESDFRDTLNEVGDYYPMSEYLTAKVSDLKKVLVALDGIEKAVAELAKFKTKIADLEVFNEMIDLDSEGGLSIGCSWVSIADAKAFLKKL